jgi:hypothetical protein
VPNRIFGHDPTGVLVRDDCPSYFSLSIPQQSCWSHLLRVPHDAAAHENASEEMKTLHKELKRMFGEIEPITREAFIMSRRKKAYRKYAKRIAVIIARKDQNNDTKAIQKRIANQNTNLLTVLLHEGAPLTSNHAERMIHRAEDLRRSKKRQRSGDSRRQHEHPADLGSQREGLFCRRCRNTPCG